MSKLKDTPLIHDGMMINLKHLITRFTIQIVKESKRYLNLTFCVASRVLRRGGFGTDLSLNNHSTSTVPFYIRFFLFNLNFIIRITL